MSEFFYVVYVDIYDICSGFLCDSNFGVYAEYEGEEGVKAGAISKL